jgi:hypothetical protein
MTYIGNIYFILGDNSFISKYGIVAIHPFDNYVTTTLFSTQNHLKWKGFQVFLMGYAIRRLCTEKQNIILQHIHENEFFILTNKCGNKL